MDKKVLKSIEELKGIVLDLHRSAGILDNMIQSINEGLEGEEEIEYKNMLIKAQVLYYLDFKKAKDFGTLEDRTVQICNQLIGF